MTTFNGEVHSGLPNRTDNLTYKSQTGLTHSKLAEALIVDGEVVTGNEDFVRNNCDWYNDLVSTGRLLRKQLFKRPLYTTTLELTV